MNHLNLKFPIIISIIVIILSFSITSCFGKDNMRSPLKPQVKNQLELYGSGDNFLLNIYQTWISPVKGGNTCPMYPACSQYAKIAFQVLPWYEAYTRSLERMLRCGNDLYMYPIIFINGQTHWYDPIIIRDSNHDLQINEDDL
jgi:putative component of membrane protein insertase Oxa1/YidC/SpoIIIJ protein YidD